MASVSQSASGSVGISMFWRYIVVWSNIGETGGSSMYSMFESYLRR